MAPLVVDEGGQPYGAFPGRGDKENAQSRVGGQSGAQSGARRDWMGVDERLEPVVEGTAIAAFAFNHT